MALLLLLLHTPPVAGSVKLTAAPPQRLVAVPVIVPADRKAPMETVAVVVAMPQAVITL